MLTTAFNDLSIKTGANLIDALDQSSGGVIAVYNDIMDDASGFMGALNASTVVYGNGTTSIVQVQFKYATFCDIGDAVGFPSEITTRSVWQDVNLTQLQTLSPSDCLETGSFSDKFMRNFNMATYACGKKDTSVTTKVASLKSALHALNKTISATTLTGSYTSSKWDTDFDQLKKQKRSIDNAQVV